MKTRREELEEELEDAQEELRYAEDKVIECEDEVERIESELEALDESDALEDEIAYIARLRILTGAEREFLAVIEERGIEGHERSRLKQIIQNHCNDRRTN